MIPRIFPGTDVAMVQYRKQNNTFFCKNVVEFLAGSLCIQDVIIKRDVEFYSLTA